VTGGDSSRSFPLSSTDAVVEDPHALAAQENPTDHSLWEKWGAALGVHADKCTEPGEKLSLLKEAAAKYAIALDLAPDRAGSITEWARLLGKQATLTADPKNKEELLNSAMERFARACSLDSDLVPAWNGLARCCFDLSVLAAEKTQARRTLLLEACKCREHIHRLKEDDARNLGSWASTLYHLAIHSKRAERADLYRLAAEKYAAAAELHPGQHYSLFFCGMALKNLAKLAEKGAKIDLYQQALSKFQSATEAVPCESDSFFQWGAVLCDLGDLADAPEKAGLYREAAARFEAAASIQPDKARYFSWWGTVLGDLATLSSAPLKEQFYRQAIEKLTTATTLKPKWAFAAYKLGELLESLSGETEGSVKGGLLQQAVEGFKTASALRPEHAYYLSRLGQALWLRADDLKDDPVLETHLQLALEKLSAALALDADDPLSWYYSGRIQTRLGMSAEDAGIKRGYWVEACESFTRTVELRPEWSAVHCRLANRLSSLADLSGDPDEQTQLYERSNACHAAATKLSPNEAVYFSNWGLMLYDHAYATESHEAELVLFREAEAKFRVALKLGPERNSDRFHLANSLTNIAALLSPDERLPLLDEAIDCYPAALDSPKRKEWVLRYWADTLCDKAKLVEAKEEKIDLVREAIELYRRAAEGKADDSASFFGLGSAQKELYLLLPKGPEDLELLRESADNFLQAYRLMPDDDAAPFNAANSYQSLANRMEDLAEKIRWLRKAARYREIAARIEPDEGINFEAWGRTLVRLSEAIERAGTTFGSNEKSLLLLKAGKKFAHSVKLDPASGSGWLGWAGVLLDRAEDHFDMGERQRFLGLARKKIVRAIGLGDPGGHFLLGRLEARERRVEQAVRALSAWRKLDSDARVQRIQKCSDFRDLEGHPAFEAFLKSWSG
jgi:hypothetical protein